MGRRGPPDPWLTRPGNRVKVVSVTDVDGHDRGQAPGTSVWAVEPGAGERPVVLTYDDGPEPGGTDAVLEVLAEHGVTATFFVLLSRTRRYPGLLSGMLAAGHEIGLHGVDHQRLTTLDPAHVAQRTADARHELEDTIGREVRWFRPPYGGQSIGTWRAICGTGLTPVVWTADLRDWMEITDDERLSGVRELTQPGAIILAHDGFATAADGASDGDPPRIDRARLSQGLIGICQSKNLTPGSLGQALAAGQLATRVWLD
jgi:peptidoglycan/xylan/chitin deacetylase (PgdA/CDA1 family)